MKKLVLAVVLMFTVGCASIKPESEETVTLTKEEAASVMLVIQTLKSQRDMAVDLLEELLQEYKKLEKAKCT
jgi:hypothetical protein